MPQLLDEKKIELLQNNINRFDHYFAASNTKSKVILAFNGVIIGSVFLKYDALVKMFEITPYCLDIAVTLIIALGVMSVISSIYAFLSIDPFLKSGNVITEYHSLLFFKSVSEIKEEVYIKKIDECSVENLKNDLARQCYQLANGLTSKYDYAKKSVYFIYINLGILLFLLILKSLVFVSGLLG